MSRYGKNKGIARLRVGLCVPTLNAGARWNEWLLALERQSLAPDVVLIIDSGSTDETLTLASGRGYVIFNIPKESFNHGSTRQRAVEFLFDCDIIVFLTQDAVLASTDSLSALIGSFNDESVAIAYGRQLPHANADLIAVHARLFNYPSTSETRTWSDRARVGIKAAFTSNSFAAYRRQSLNDVGGFPYDAILSEDMIVAARMLMNGMSIAYCSDALVRHSHNYTIVQEFRRYFDIGVLHAREAWLLEKFGSPEGEGRRFVVSEIKYLIAKAPWLLFSSLIRTGCKYVGYRLGRAEGGLSNSIKKKLSMNPTYWSGKRNAEEDKE